MQSPTGQLYCDFCGKREDECGRIIVTATGCPDSAICRDCVLVCLGMLINGVGKRKLFPLRPATPEAE